jgi:plastocyanin
MKEKVALVVACLLGGMALASPKERTVFIHDHMFDPAKLQVRVGETVKWVNQDGDSHTVTALDGQFSSGALETRESFRWTAKAPGTLQYDCTSHANMEGVVTVLK